MQLKELQKENQHNQINGLYIIIIIIKNIFKKKRRKRNKRKTTTLTIKKEMQPRKGKEQINK